jgi:redox-sensitive bicupin YhaK (pirin superfamily)
MDQPSYFPLTSENVPQRVSGSVALKVFSGEVSGLKGSMPSYTEVNAATVEMKKGGNFETTIPGGHNAFIYLLDGKLNLDGYGLVEGLNAVVFKNDGDGIGFEALEDTRVLLLTGKPLEEKVVSHGPFVMNNQRQDLEAMRDYQMGKMGVLIES